MSVHMLLFKILITSENDFTACELLADSRNYIPGRIRRVKPGKAMAFGKLEVRTTAYAVTIHKSINCMIHELMPLSHQCHVL